MAMITIWNHHERILHKRKVYKLLDVLGDFGGVQAIVFIVVPLIVNFFAEHSFYIRAFQLLFLLKTRSLRIRNKFLKVKQHNRRFKKHEFDSLKYRLPF